MGNPWFSLLGAHELCVKRNGSCLQFWRWSASEQCTKRWANLCFLTWEGESRAHLLYHVADVLRNGFGILLLSIIQDS